MEQPVNPHREIAIFPHNQDNQSPSFKNMFLFAFLSEVSSQSQPRVIPNEFLMNCGDSANYRVPHSTSLPARNACMLHLHNQQRKMRTVTTACVFIIAFFCRTAKRVVRNACFINESFFANFAQNKSLTPKRLFATEYFFYLSTNGKFPLVIYIQ